MAKKPTPKAIKSMEKILWESADKLGGSAKSSEFMHVLPDLIFWEFVSDNFVVRIVELVPEGKEKYLEMREFSDMDSFLDRVPESSWPHEFAHSKQGDISLFNLLNVKP